MKLAGLLPFKPDPTKDRLEAALKCMANVCDEIIVLHDRPHQLPTPALPIGVTEELWVSSRGAWNDFCLRLTLLARAAHYGCRWAMWLDSDEALGEGFTRKRAHNLCADADLNGFTTIMARVRTAWNETHWRCDGVFANQQKHFLQVNPFMLKDFKFEHGPEDVLHNFPTIVGPRFLTTAHIIHYGLNTPELRAANVAKYLKADPAGKFTDISYDYLLDETGLKLKPLNEP